MSESLSAEDGSAVLLGERIGRGGEGEVFALADDPAGAAKLYTVDDLESRREKVTAIVERHLAESSPLVSFPSHVLFRRGRFAGFTMRRVTGCKPLFELYAPGSRRRAFPGVDYRFLVRAAANAARAVAAVHATGCVIGDINHSGLLVSPQAVVALIDADSFQVEANGRIFFCRVGVPEYTPPELQGRSLDSVVRTPTHDHFGLAVVVFQLLFMGRHPFSGAYADGEMPLELAIAEHRFAYAETRDTGMSPPPAVPRLAEWPAAVADAFERAFAPGDGSRRPSAAEWIDLLTGLEADLVACEEDSLHFYPREASHCPWCRMERLQGISLFAPPPPDELGADQPGGRFDPAAAMAAIATVTPPPYPPRDPPGVPLAAAIGASGLAARPLRRLRFGAALALLLVAPFLVALGVAHPVAGWALAGLALLVAVAPDPATLRLARKARGAERDWSMALADWRERVARERFDSLRDSLQAAGAALRVLPAQEVEAQAAYRRNRRREQLDRFLQGFPLRGQRLPEVPDTLVATLASYGIETAADVNEWALLQVPGVGRKATWQIMAWRRRTEGRFRYSGQPNAADRAALADIAAEYAQRRRHLQAEVAGGADRLTRLRDDMVARQTAPDPTLIALAAARAQARADLRLW